MILNPSKGYAKVCLSLLIASALALSACAEQEKTKTQFEEQQGKAEKAMEQLKPSAPIAQPLMIDKRPYYGSAAVPLSNGSALPAQFEQNNALVMTFARPVTMPEFARMIQSVTGLRAMAGTASSGGGAEAVDTEGTFMPSDGEEVAGGRVVWQGRLSDLLNQASDVYGADWSFDGSSISFNTQITRTFMLHSLATEMKMSGSVTSGGGDSGESSGGPTMDVTDSVSMQVWSEIKDAVGTIMGGNGNASFSPSTGTITVSGGPTAVRQVEAYLNQQNSMRLRRVAVAVKVLSVVANNDLDLSADLTGIIKRAFDQASLRTVGEATSGIAIGVLKRPIGGEIFEAGDGSDMDQIQSDRIITELRANKGIDRVSVSHSGVLVTLSDQPAPLQVGRQISYLARTSATTGDAGSGSVSLEPGTVSTGLMMSILPRIVEQNRILMRISVAITDAQQPFATFGSGTNQIQLPEVETTGFLQNAVVTSGETMVLAGFEKELASTSETGTPIDGPIGILLGGAKDTSRSKELTVLILTSEILPEEPMTVIGQ